MNKKALVAILAGSIMASGCAVRIADITVGSTKNYDINSKSFIKGDRVVGEDTAPVFLFPLGIPNLKSAVDDAIEKDRCAVGLSDLVITQLNQAFLIGRIGYRVEGDLIIDQSQPGCENAS